MVAQKTGMDSLRSISDALVQLAEANVGIAGLPDTPARRRMQAALGRALDEVRGAMRPLAVEVMERERAREVEARRARIARRLMPAHS